MRRTGAADTSEPVATENASTKADIDSLRGIDVRGLVN
jgi:hypothetical protein